MQVTSSIFCGMQLLLQGGHNPDLPELHPMGVDAVIRSDVPRPEHATARHAELARAIEARFSGPGPHEVTRFALEPGPSEDA